MIELTFLIPVASNEAVTFTPKHHAQFEAVLIDHFDGFTRLPGEVVGGWSDGETVFHDTTIAYVVAIVSIVDGTKVATVVAFAKVHYAQKAIYVRYLGLSEVL